MTRRSLSKADELLLMARSAGRCQFNGCNKLLTRDELTRTDGRYGVFAHIVAASADGPRGDAVRSIELQADIENLMVLCADHHRLIDHERVEEYTESVLLKFKKDHEDRIERVTALGPDMKTLLVIYQSKIGDRTPAIVDSEIVSAIRPHYPAHGSLHADTSGLSIKDGSSTGWSIAQEEVAELAQKLRRTLSKGATKHVSVFALAPIPHLFLLGQLIGDIATIDVFQRRREPPGWLFDEPDVATLAFTHQCQVQNPNPELVVILVSISGKVELPSEELDAINADHAVYELQVTAPARVDLVRTRADIRAFRAAARDLLNELATKYGDTPIAIFPAMPNSLAIELGRVWLPKAHAQSVTVFDRMEGRWVPFQVDGGTQG